MERTPASPQIVDCECVPEGVQRSDWWFKAEVTAERLDIAQGVALEHRGTFGGCEQEGFRLSALDGSEQMRPQFHAERY